MLLVSVIVTKTMNTQPAMSLVLMTMYENNQQGANDIKKHDSNGQKAINGGKSGNKIDGN